MSKEKALLDTAPTAAWDPKPGLQRRSIHAKRPRSCGVTAAWLVAPTGLVQATEIKV